MNGPHQLDRLTGPCRDGRAPDRQRRNDRRGNLASITAIALVPVVAAVGFGVDYARVSLVRSELQRGVDAAALGGARVINADGSNSDEVGADARMYFWANYRKDVAEAQIVGANPAVTILDPNRDTVQVVAHADVPLVFGNFLGMPQLRTHAEASAQRSAGGMEVVLVLDNTGSMKRGTRIADLRAGARDLVDILYSGRTGEGGDVDEGSASDTKKLMHCTNPSNKTTCTTEYTLTVGIVPFITTVNVSPGRGNSGSGKRSIVDPKKVKAANWGKHNGWKGCVMARPYPFEEGKADAPPTVSPFEPYLWNATGGNAWSADDTKEEWPDAAAPSGKSKDNRSDVGAGHGREDGPNKGCGQPIMPLQASRSVAKAQIDGLDVGAGNGTAVPLGLAWGWRLLSPDWRPYWSDGKTKVFARGKEKEAATPPDLPRDYGAKNYEKVIVLFSDGQNQISGGRSPTECCMSGYGDPGTVTANLGWDAIGEVNRRTIEVCSAIKARGIKIYVVLLYPDPPSALIDMYNEKGCASGRNFFFHASSESQLRDIFRQVGSQLKNLRLVN